MLKTFANLPEEIESAISKILSEQPSKKWMTQAEKLHDWYMNPDKEIGDSFIQSFDDVLGYLALRSPSTYAQIFGTLSQVQELLPSWKPKTLLDLGSGPGTALWAAKSIFPGLKESLAIDRERFFLSVGKEIFKRSDYSLHTEWFRENITLKLDFKNNSFDLVIIANVLNELSPEERESLIKHAFTVCQGVLIIVEPGTPVSAEIIQESADTVTGKHILLAPFINSSPVESKDYWIHFPQRFIRPEFERRVRQNMRSSSLMASDWEETKYSFTAISKIPAETKIWGRIVGPVKKTKAYFQVPVLTEKKIEQVQVMKKSKDQYNFAKKLKWGEVIETREDLVP